MGHPLHFQRTRYKVMAFKVTGSGIAKVTGRGRNAVSIEVSFKRIEAWAKSMKVDEATLAKRREAWVCPPPNVTTGYLSRYAKLVSSANKGAIVE